MRSEYAPAHFVAAFTLSIILAPEKSLLVLKKQTKVCYRNNAIRIQIPYRECQSCKLPYIYNWNQDLPASFCIISHEFVVIFRRYREPSLNRYSNVFNLRNECRFSIFGPLVVGLICAVFYPTSIESQKMVWKSGDILTYSPIPTIYASRPPKTSHEKEFVVRLYLPSE